MIQAYVPSELIVLRVSILEDKQQFQSSPKTIILIYITFSF